MEQKKLIVVMTYSKVESTEPILIIVTLILWAIYLQDVYFFWEWIIRGTLRPKLEVLLELMLILIMMPAILYPRLLTGFLSD